MTSGIDVSHHQSVIDWKKVKASGVQFAILRAGYGRLTSQKDKQFENNYKGCKDNDIPCGVYWYSYANSASDAKAEAEACYQIIKDKQFKYPILFDIEESTQVELGKAICSEMCKAFCDTLESKGYFAGIYTFDSFAQTNITEEVKKRYTMAIARIGSEPKYSPYDIWQYSWTGKINGISGDVDLDYCYRNFIDIIKTAGLNGFEKTNDTPSDTLNVDLKYDVNGDGKVTSEDALKILQNVVSE